MYNAIIDTLDFKYHFNNQYNDNIYQLDVTNITRSATYFVYDCSDATFKFIAYGGIDKINMYAILLIYHSVQIVVPMPGINLKTHNCLRYDINEHKYYLRDYIKPNLNNNAYIELKYNKIYRPFTDGEYDFGTVHGNGQYYTNQKYKLGMPNITYIQEGYITWEFDNDYTGTAYLFNPLALPITIFQNTTRQPYTNYMHNKFDSFDIISGHICVIFKDNDVMNLIDDFVNSVFITIQPKDILFNINKSNLFDYKNAINGYALNYVSGSIQENNVCCYQDEFIPVYPGQYIYVTNHWHNILFYDFNYNFSHGVNSNDTYSESTKEPIYQYKIDHDIYFIRISTLNNCKNKLQVSYRHEDIKFYNKDIVNLKELYLISNKNLSSASRLFSGTTAIQAEETMGTAYYNLTNNSNCTTNAKIKTRCNNILVGTEIKFNQYDNDIYFGLDSTIIENDTSAMGQSALIHLNTTNKTISFESGNMKLFRTQQTAFSVKKQSTYTADINLNYTYLLTLHKHNVCKYDIEFKCVNTGETVTSFTHLYAVDESNPNIVLNQVRGWGGPYCYCLTGDISLYNLFENYTGPLNPRVAIFGDSYIENLGKNYLASWANRLYDALDGEVFIAGYGGCSMTGLLWRLPVEMNLCNPKYTVLATGVNDSYRANLDTYYEGVEKFIKWCEYRNTEPIFITCPICESGGNSNVEKAREITDFVRNSGYKYIDYRAALCTEDDDTADWHKYLSDKVHPNIAGGAAIFTWIEANLPELVY